MNEIINTFLLAGDKFVPEMHLRQPGFTYSACGPFTKNRERIFQDIYQNKLDKVFFHHNMAYGDFDKILCDKTFNTPKNPKYDGYHRGLASMVYKFHDKKSSGGGIKNENIPNQQLAEELHRPIIGKLMKQTVHTYKQYLGCWSSRYVISK